MLSHELEKGPYASYNLSQRLGVGVEQDLAFDRTQEHLYLLTGNMVWYKIFITAVCLLGIEINICGLVHIQAVQ